MPANRRNVFETIRDKRQWHSPPDAEAAKLDFRGWHSRGFLPHFDMPGLVQFINYIRDEAHYRKVARYIESNPVKAGLVKSPEQWPFRSAHFRDEYNRLKLPAKAGLP